MLDRIDEVVLPNGVQSLGPLNAGLKQAIAPPGNDRLGFFFGRPEAKQVFRLFNHLEEVFFGVGCQIDTVYRFLMSALQFFFFI